MAGGVHVHDLVPFGTQEFDTSHEIHQLAFGQTYPGLENPLDGLVIKKINDQNREGKTGAYQYFLKVRFCQSSSSSFSKVLNVRFLQFTDYMPDMLSANVWSDCLS